MIVVGLVLQLYFTGLARPALLTLLQNFLAEHYITGVHRVPGPALLMTLSAQGRACCTWISGIPRHQWLNPVFLVIARFDNDVARMRCTPRFHVVHVKFLVFSFKRSGISRNARRC